MVPLDLTGWQFRKVRRQAAYADLDRHVARFVVMLTIQIIKGRHHPVLSCDRCNKAIEDHEAALFVYQEPGSPVMVLHPDCEDEHAYQHHFSLPLQDSLVELSLGLGVDWEEAIRVRTRREMLTE